MLFHFCIFSALICAWVDEHPLIKHGVNEGHIRVGFLVITFFKSPRFHCLFEHLLAVEVLVGRLREHGWNLTFRSSSAGLNLPGIVQTTTIEDG